MQPKVLLPSISITAVYILRDSIQLCIYMLVKIIYCKLVDGEMNHRCGSRIASIIHNLTCIAGMPPGKAYCRFYLTGEMAGNVI